MGRGRSSQRHIESARKVLAQAGIETTLRPTSARGDATKLAREAVAENRDMIIVCGGDGTINEVVNGMAGSRVPLAVLPAGTANILAKELGLPWNVSKAAALIARGKHRRIAMGMVSPAGNSETSAASDEPPTDRESVANPDYGYTPVAVAVDVVGENGARVDNRSGSTMDLDAPPFRPDLAAGAVGHHAAVR